MDRSGALIFFHAESTSSACNPRAAGKEAKKKNVGGHYFNGSINETAVVLFLTRAEPALACQRLRENAPNAAV